MDNDRTIVTAQTAASVQASGAQARRRPIGADGYPVCAAKWYPMGDAAGRIRLLWDDLLAALARLAASGRVETTPCDAAIRTAPARATRSITCRGRFIVRARCPRGKKTGPNPTDRRKAGSKHHVITDAQGVPLAASVTGANAHDISQLLPLVDAIPPIAGKRGAPLTRPQRVLADRAYDSQPHRQALAERGIQSGLAWRRLPHGTGLGTLRWVVERTIAWLHQFRRLRVRYEKRADIHEAFLSMGCCLICFRTLKKSFC